MADTPFADVPLLEDGRHQPPVPDGENKAGPAPG